MPQITEHAPGWPIWVALNTTDFPLSQGFYTQLFGWDYYTLTLTERGDVNIFTLGGIQGPEVAGMHPLVDDTEPSSWTCYFRVDDVDAMVDVVKSAGGQELSPPTDVADLGRSTLCCDSQGAEFALVRPYNFAGAGVVDEPSAMCWVELACRDPGEARRFYHHVFGWQAVDRPSHGSSYTDFKLGEWPVAGMVPMDYSWPPQYPPQWIPYFAVADCDAIAARAVGLGARIPTGPDDLPSGRCAILHDPTGARLGIIAMRPGDGAACRPFT
ncbi:MAG TPA: VOC family protein [Streptosporangiaceae bacterium]|jgi:predicted enzyme related to lactoylglutathione lyase|nr:VOC family protein [Streptosporangiaceae bacterium]